MRLAEKQRSTRPSSGSSPNKDHLPIYDIWHKLRDQRDFAYIIIQ